MRQFELVLSEFPVSSVDHSPRFELDCGCLSKLILEADLDAKFRCTKLPPLREKQDLAHVLTLRDEWRKVLIEMA